MLLRRRRLLCELLVKGSNRGLLTCPGVKFRTSFDVDSVRLLGGEGLLQRTWASYPDAYASRCFPCPQRSCSAEPGPSLSDPALLMVGMRVASTYGDGPSRRQPPSRSRPGFPWLHPTVGLSIRAAAVYRPAHTNSTRSTTNQFLTSETASALAS